MENILEITCGKILVFGNYTLLYFILTILISPFILLIWCTHSFLLYYFYNDYTKNIVKKESWIYKLFILLLLFGYPIIMIILFAILLNYDNYKYIFSSYETLQKYKEKYEKKYEKKYENKISDIKQALKNRVGIRILLILHLPIFLILIKYFIIKNIINVI